jgi:hypothetical protein
VGAKKGDGRKRQKAGTDKLEARCKKLETKVKSLELRCAKLDLYAGLFKEIAYTANKRFQLDTFLDRIMNRVVRATSCESATLFMHDEADNTLKFAVVRGPAEKEAM